MSKKNYDVSPNGKKWQVKKHGNSNASKTFKTQKEAINYGRKRAKQDKGELYIKNRKGQELEKQTLMEMKLLHFGRHPVKG